MLLAGYLASISWSAPFNVYWLGLFIFILAFLFLPKDKPIKADTEQTTRARIPISIYGLALATCVIMLVYYAIATNMALYLEQSELGESRTAGLVISFTTIGGMIASIVLVQLELLLKEKSILFQLAY